MNLDDYVSAMTVGMARAPERRATGLAVLAKGFELEQPCRPELRSLAVRGADGALIGYSAWLASLGGPVAAGTSVMHIDRPGLPLHVAETFRGTNPRLTFAGQRAYVLEVMRSRSYAMSSAEFVAWTRAQPAADAALLRVAAFISDSNLVSGRRPVPAGEVDTYLMSPAGEQVFEAFAAELVREVQLAVRNNGRKLVKPDNGWFATPPDYESYFGGVSHDEQLELVGEVTADDLTTIFDAQLCRSSVWAAVRRKLTEMRLPEDLDAVPYDELAMVHRVLLGAMQMVCHDSNVEVVRPSPLADRLGTHIDHMSELERSEFLPTSEHLLLAANAQAWECWCFRDIGPAAVNDDKPPPATATADILAALDAIADFARSIASGFAETFATAAWVLRSKEAMTLLSAQTREAALRKLSEPARQALRDRLPICDDFAAVGYDVPALRTLLACDLASVFGGMASWNDAGLPDEVAAQHRALSSRLFECLERLRTSVV